MKYDGFGCIQRYFVEPVKEIGSMYYNAWFRRRMSPVDLLESILWIYLWTNGMVNWKRESTIWLRSVDYEINLWYVALCIISYNIFYESVTQYVPDLLRWQRGYNILLLRFEISNNISKITIATVYRESSIKCDINHRRWISFCQNSVAHILKINRYLFPISFILYSSSFCYALRG